MRAGDASGDHTAQGNDANDDADPGFNDIPGFDNDHCGDDPDDESHHRRDGPCHIGANVSDVPDSFPDSFPDIFLPAFHDDSRSFRLA